MAKLPEFIPKEQMGRAVEILGLDPNCVTQVDMDPDAIRVEVVHRDDAGKIVTLGKDKIKKSVHIIDVTP